MNTIGVIKNSDKEGAEEAAERIRSYLEKHHRNCCISGSGRDLPEECGCALVLGGDGTLLRAAKTLLERQIPLLGVNLGNLGYLAEIEVKNLEGALDRLMEDRFTVEQRMMLTGTIRRGGREIFSDTALNDIVLNRSGPLRTFRYMEYVNDLLLNTLSADGVIVSTATGSTSYSLSAGGPVVSPSAELIVMTPLAPHSMISRSIILPPADRIRIEIGQGRTGQEAEAAAVSFDGSRGIPIGTGDSVEIQRSRRYTNIIKINHISFLEVLRRKMADT